MGKIKEKLKEKLKKISVRAIAVIVALSSCIKIHNKNDKTLEKQEDKIENIDGCTMEDAYKKGLCRSLNTYTQKVSYITDTVVLNRHNYNKRICAGLYREATNKVYIKHFIPDTTSATPLEAQKILKYAKKWNEEAYKRSNIVHEFKHMHTIKKGCLNLNLSANDYARMCQHNEISSYLGNFLFERETYLLAIRKGLCTQEDALKLISPRFEKYKEAIRNGTIKPQLMNFIDQQKENELIMEVVSDAWIKKEQKVNAYVTKKRLKNKFAKNKNFISQRNGLLYKSCLDVCYTHIKDGMLVNFNFFYNLDNKTPLKDVEVQPQIEEYIKYEKEKHQKNLNTLALNYSNKKTATH